MNSRSDDAQAVTVTCIVPAYNEAARIGAVLTALSAHPSIHEIIVVDDRSTDDTAAVAEGFTRVTTLRLSENGGKTRALAAGFSRARGEVLLLIDADLIGLDGRAVTDLLGPVLSGRTDVSISLRSNAPRLWHMLGIDYISGERALRRDMLDDRRAELGTLPRFGFEVWMNGVIVANRSRISVVKWPRVRSPAKASKRGLATGILADVRMISDMMHTVAPLHLMRQIAAMRRLRIKR